VPPPAAPAPVDFGSALAHSSPAATVASSLDALLRRWGSDPLGADLLSLPQFSELLENTGFAVLVLEDASNQLVSAIEPPAQQVLRALDGAPRGLLLTPIAGDVLTLEGVGPTPLRVSPQELAAHWSGSALVPWRDHAALPPLVGPGTSGPSVRWLQDGLAGLGFYVGSPNGRFDAETREAVRAFQTEESLPVDGWVGPITLIRLYARLPDYAAPPRLIDGGTS
jgi:general secretion pathway protein A